MFDKKMKINAETWDIWQMHKWMMDDCKVFDNKLPGAENVLDKYLLELYSFLCYVAGNQNKEESNFIRAFIKKSDCPDLITKKPIIMDNIYIPETLRFLIDFENQVLEKNIPTETIKFCKQTFDSWTVVLLRIFAAFGYSMLISDNKFHPDELERFTVLIKNYQSYIYENLKKKDFGTSMRIVLSTESDNGENTIIIEDSPHDIGTKDSELEKLQDKQENIEKKIDYL